MSAPVTVYGLPGCDSCRRARRWLDAAGCAHRFVDYRAEPLPPALLRRCGAALGGLDALANRRSRSWRELSPAQRGAAGEAAWLALFAAAPTLIRRPLLVHDALVLSGFDAATWQARLQAAGLIP